MRQHFVDFKTVVAIAEGTDFTTIIAVAEKLRQRIPVVMLKETGIAGDIIFDFYRYGKYNL